MAMTVVRLGMGGMGDCSVADGGRPRRPTVEPHGMRARFLPAAPVTCEACDADAFAILATATNPEAGTTHVRLRCGACGLRQVRDLDAKTAAGFREHLDATQRQIARVLAAMLRAAANDA